MGIASTMLGPLRARKECAFNFRAHGRCVSAVVVSEEAVQRERLGVRLADHLRTREVKIPPYPALAAALERIRSEGSTLAQVTAIVETDPALAATVLRRASSAALRTTSAPITLDTAIWRLGFDELLQLVFATTLGPTALRAGDLAPLRRDQWRRSLLAAAMCKELAPRRGVAPDLAFLAGLLYGFGAVVVACIEALEGELPPLPLTAWRRLIRELENDFGVVLANTWNLPAAIVEAIAHHHTPGDCMRIHRPIVQLVATVDTAITILDRNATASALEDIAGLDHDERFRICALLPRVAEQMAAFEHHDSPQPNARITGVIDRVETWPCSAALTSKTGAVYRATEIGTDVIVFRGRTQLVAGWLAELTLELASSVPLLVNVRSCEELPDGMFSMTARPFGLDGASRDAWTSLLARGRELVEPPEEE